MSFLQQKEFFHNKTQEIEVYHIYNIMGYNIQY